MEPCVSCRRCRPQRWCERRTERWTDGHVPRWLIRASGAMFGTGPRGGSCFVGTEWSGRITRTASEYRMGENRGDVCGRERRGRADRDFGGQVHCGRDKWKRGDDGLGDEAGVGLCLLAFSPTTSSSSSGTPATTTQDIYVLPSNPSLAYLSTHPPPTWPPLSPSHALRLQHPSTILDARLMSPPPQAILTSLPLRPLSLRREPPPCTS